MTTIDETLLDTARRFLAANPPPGTLLMCAVTGSHIYGFTSPDSDIDLKGIHVAPTASFLGLSGPRETFDRLRIFEEVECDLTTHELGRAIGWVLKGNGNMLERIFSPIQLVRSDALTTLQELTRASLSQRAYNHYAGFFKGMQRESVREGDAPRAKTLLYSYRVALTGIHLLLTGEVYSDLSVLARTYNYAQIEPLIAFKRAGTEKGVLPMAEAETYRVAWARLETHLAAALARSPLPQHPPNADDFEAWLIELRKQQLS